MKMDIAYQNLFVAVPIQHLSGGMWCVKNLIVDRWVEKA
jgi:hypothetical protein